MIFIYFWAQFCVLFCDFLIFVRYLSEHVNDVKIVDLQQEYFSFLCKYVFNITILPSQALMLCEMWNRKFPMLIASRGFGKSFILSLYSLIRALLLPERKVVVVGAAFRQSKVLFEYM